MTNIVILGAGVMGSALAVPAAEHKDNVVTLVGSPLDDHLIQHIQADRIHPRLKVAIPSTVQATALGELEGSLIRQADVIVLGVSSPGIDWAIKLLNDHQANPSLLALVTKGLVDNPNPTGPPLTYADVLPEQLNTPNIPVVGIGGPCIARELGLKFPTRVTFASTHKLHADNLRKILQTHYYRITTSHHVVAVEACAALKNFLCIGVSAMLSAYPLDQQYAKNPVAALFNQAVLELMMLSRWIAAEEYARLYQEKQSNPTQVDTAFDLAGLGDLHVTVGGGRNSRLGSYIGDGRLLNDVLDKEMAGVTVEGVDTGRRLSAGFMTACHSGILSAKNFPLTSSIIDTIENNAPFEFDFSSLPG